MGISIPIQNTVANTGVDRATLVRRTYLMVVAILLATFAGTAFAFSQPAVLSAAAAHPFILMFAGFAPLIMAGRLRDSKGISIALALVFGLIQGVTLSPLMYFYSQRAPGVLGQAAILTLSTFGVLTLYAFVSKRDFSAWGTFFRVGLWVLIATTLLNYFFKNTAADLWLASATVLVFSGLLVFDTWRLRNRYGPNDYVPAAINIYLDLLNLFLAILRLTDRRR